MNIVLSFIFLLFSFASFGQRAKILILKKRNPFTKEIYVFPKAVASSFQATEKINKAMRDMVLGVTENITDANIFDSVWRNVSDLSFQVSQLNARLISLSISGQGCGAYCEPFTYYFTFNTKTGNQLTLDSLFTPVGIKTLVYNLNLNRNKRVLKKIKELNTSLRLRKVKNTRNDILEKKQLYTDCLAKKINPSYIAEIGFLCKSGNLKIYTERCSVHYNMTLDDLWTFQYQITLKDYAKMLTDFGRTQMR